MTGSQLKAVLQPDELNEHQLAESGIQPESIIRVNRHGDIEVRRKYGWKILGGLLGDYEQRITGETGLSWSGTDNYDDA